MSAANTPDRIGRHLPELMEQLAAPRVPDYFDDMLRATAATRQRPAWASLERWLPMGVVARPAPLGLPSWRPVILIVMLALVLAAAAAVFTAGSRPKLAPPYGLAANGVVLAGTAGGDIVTIDPVTGHTRPLLATGAQETFPGFLPTGGTLLYSILNPLETIYAANPDGSGAHSIYATPSGRTIDWVDITADGTRLVASTKAGDSLATEMVDTSSGASTPVEAPGLVIHQPSFRQGGGMVFIGEETTGAHRFAAFVMAAGGAVRQVGPWGADDRAYLGPTVSLDGRSLAYARWNDQVEGQLHVLDLETGADKVVGEDGGKALTQLQPVWSPDGRFIAETRYQGTTFRIGIVPVAGGPATMIGGVHPQGAGEPQVMFSPDGTKLLVAYKDDQSAWIYDIASGVGVRVEGLGFDGLAWQRRAP